MPYVDDVEQAESDRESGGGKRVERADQEARSQRVEEQDRVDGHRARRGGVGMPVIASEAKQSIVP